MANRINMEAHQNTAVVVCMIILCLNPAAIAKVNAQADTTRTDMIAVTTRPFADSVILRWAPLTYNAWRTGNEEGYRIERYLISRNGKLLSGSERVTLASSVKPHDEAQWPTLVRDNRYAAIAAQALFGDNFEVDLNQSDVFTIVNKVKENEQRFAFALFSADISPPVAKASGLWYVDKTVKADEKYLYRIIANGSPDIRGSAFVGTGDEYDLPKPKNLKGEFQDGAVSLRWDRVPLTPYTAFSVERSVDGLTFVEIADTPMVTLSPGSAVDNRYEYAVDSLPDNSVTCYYRVKGITPFGEEGPPSDIISGKAIATVEQVPYIRSAVNVDNTSIVVTWEFPETSNASISGFHIERSFGPDEKYVTLNQQLIGPLQREFEDKAPGSVNYYRIQAHGLDGEQYPSHAYFAQLIDSIPPHAPVELAAVADDSGRIALSWKPNNDADIYGYRVYRSYQSTAEPAQITEAPLRSNTFIDSISLNTLNDNVHYRLMAVDVNQNHSPLSEILSVSLPDRVRPQAPVILPGISDTTGVALSWIAGASQDIVAYKIYRRVGDEPGWSHLRTEHPSQDSVYRFVDKDCPAGKTVHYTILSVDDAGLESMPAHPVTRACLPSKLPSAATWKRPTMIREQNRVKLVWASSHSGISSFRLFRSVNNGPPVLFRTLEGKEREYTDRIIPGNAYGYRIMACFATGVTSALSEELKLEY